jgi:hypothetical protein
MMDTFAPEHNQAISTTARSVTHGSIPAIIIVITSGSLRGDLAEIG